MTQLSTTLTQYVSGSASLGQPGTSRSGARRITSRAMLLQQLSADVSDTRTVLAVWLGMNLAVFALLCAALLLRLVEPYVAIPGGCASLFMLMGKLESVWREMRQQQLAINIALSCRDEKLLRELMTTLNASLLLDAKARAALLKREERDAAAAA